MGLRLVDLDPDRAYPPHLLVTDQPDNLRLNVDLMAGADLRLVFLGRPHAAVAHVLSSTYRDRGGPRPSYYPLVALPMEPRTGELLEALNCCKWSERLLDLDWDDGLVRYRVFGCRLTERYLLEFIYLLYRMGGFVIPGHMGDRRNDKCSQPFHIDLAQGRDLGLEVDVVAEIRRRYNRDLNAAIGCMTPEERRDLGIPENADPVSH